MLLKVQKKPPRKLRGEKTNKEKLMLLSKCAVCDSKKLTIIKF